MSATFATREQSRLYRELVEEAWLAAKKAERMWFNWTPEQREAYLKGARLQAFFIEGLKDK